MKLGNMLTEEDIKKIIEANREVFATKEDFESLKQGIIEAGMEVFATKEDLQEFMEEMRKSFSDLQTSVDAYAKKADTYFQEMVALSHQVKRHERWLHQIAEKLGIKLEY